MIISCKSIELTNYMRSAISLSGDLRRRMVRVQRVCWQNLRMPRTFGISCEAGIFLQRFFRNGILVSNRARVRKVIFCVKIRVLNRKNFATRTFKYFCQHIKYIYNSKSMHSCIFQILVQVTIYSQLKF